MTNDSRPTIIPFGKHKGRSIEEIRTIDPQYLEWLCNQDWFSEKFINIYQTIINYNIEPTETPEHNALQTQFLDNEFCKKLYLYLNQIQNVNNFKIKRIDFEVGGIIDVIIYMDSDVGETR